ncbi:MAG: ATP-binding protein, partial [Armatimonadota bacterium]|nr:ATP-binding protein [Armatimonadota bacterium]
AILPLRSGGETVGVMTVSNSRQKGIVTEEQLNGMLPFTAQAATTVRAAIIRDRLRAEKQRSNAIDASRKSFERDMIHSVTDGKLNLCESPEIKDRLGDQVLTLSVSNPSDVSRCRQALSQAAFDAGMTADRKGDFELCVGEAATNCVQHGGGGHLELYVAGSSLQVRVCDGGPGIHSSLLPRATLLKGYSTKTSLGVGFSVIINLCDHLYLSTSEGGTDFLVEMSMDRKSEEDLIWAQLGMSLEAVA